MADDRLERPLPGNSSYNLNFIDWENEWEAVSERPEDYAAIVDSAWEHIDQAGDDEEALAAARAAQAAEDAESDDGDAVDDETFAREWTYDRLLALDDLVRRCEGVPPSQLRRLRPRPLCELVALSDDWEQCVVCLEELRPEQDAIQLACEHLFHVPCLRTWLRDKHQCPTCRYDLWENPPSGSGSGSGVAGGAGGAGAAGDSGGEAGDDGDNEAK